MANPITHWRLPVVPSDDWNTFLVVKIDKKCSVWLNGSLVVDKTSMKNLLRSGITN